MDIGDLTRQTITIEIDRDGSNYRLDFTGCKFLDVYRVMKYITKGFETGEIFTDGLAITDLNTGEPADADEIRQLIARAKEEIESEGTD